MTEKVKCGWCGDLVDGYFQIIEWDEGKPIKEQWMCFSCVGYAAKGLQI